MAAIELYSTPLFNDASLVSYWRMEGNSNDSKGSNNGSDTAISYDASHGKFNQGAELLRASSSRIYMGDIASLEPASALSFSLWISITANPAAYCAIGGNDLSGEPRGYLFDMNTTQVNFSIGDSSSWGAVSVNIPSAGFHHFVGTWDGTVRLYLDGVSVGTPVSKASISYTGCGFTLGNYYSNTTQANMFNGYMDDVAIFSRVLTATEISNLYNGTWTSIKKVGGVAYASIKKISGVAIASVKKVGGVA